MLLGMVGCLQEKFLSDTFFSLKGIDKIIIRKSKMDSRDLLKLIGKNEDSTAILEKIFRQRYTG